MRAIDLHAAVAALFCDTLQERVSEFVSAHRGVYVMAVGGFPVLAAGDSFEWCDGPFTVERVAAHVNAGLGASGLLTYMNRSGMSLERLGAVCAKRGHDWAYHWISATLLFCGHDLRAELSFARDGRFFMSWPVVDVATGTLFAATASLKDWNKFLSHRQDDSFDQSARRAMTDAWDQIRLITRTDAL